MKLFYIIIISGLFIQCAENSKPYSAELVKSQVEPIIIAKSGNMNQDETATKSLEEVMGKFDPKAHKDFVHIDKKYADRAGMLMHQDAYNSFVKMWQAAKQEGISLTVRSATRNFDYQRGIWERKWNGHTKVGGKALNESEPNPVNRARKILEYSSMPGTSRHHWGTDIDLNAFENSYFEQGQGKLVYEWLKKHAESYGFCQPYTAKGNERPAGYNEEKWHWSYMPIAKQYFQTAKDSMEDSMIQGFAGSETAKEIHVVKNYILGVSQHCQ